MVKAKVFFFWRAGLFPAQQKKTKKFSKSSDWLENAGPPKKPLLFWSWPGSVYMIKTKVAFGGPAFFSQSGLFENFSDYSDCLDKSRPSKKNTFVLIM